MSTNVVNGINEDAASAACENNHDKPAQPITTEAEVAAKKGKTMNKTKKPRISAADFKYQRDLVFAALDENPTVSNTKLSIDLGMPEDRVSKFRQEWQDRDAAQLFCRRKQLADVLTPRLKRANGEDLGPDTILLLEFVGDNQVVVTPYERG